MLPDGTYDAIVVDADRVDDDPGIAIEVAIASGEHRGAVVSLIVRHLDRDPLDLLALPATLVVEGGEPRLALEG